MESNATPKTGIQEFWHLSPFTLDYMVHLCYYGLYSLLNWAGSFGVPLFSAEKERDAITGMDTSISRSTQEWRSPFRYVL